MAHPHPEPDPTPRRRYSLDPDRYRARIGPASGPRASIGTDVTADPIDAGQWTGPVVIELGEPT